MKTGSHLVKVSLLFRMRSLLQFCELSKLVGRPRLLIPTYMLLQER